MPSVTRTPVKAVPTEGSGFSITNSRQYRRARLHAGLTRCTEPVLQAQLEVNLEAAAERQKRLWAAWTAAKPPAARGRRGSSHRKHRSV